METIEKMIEDFKKVLDDSNHTSPETLKHEMIQWLDETLSPRLKQVLEERETQSSSYIIIGANCDSVCCLR